MICFFCWLSWRATSFKFIHIQLHTYMHTGIRSYVHTCTYIHRYCLVAYNRKHTDNPQDLLNHHQASISCLAQGCQYTPVTVRSQQFPYRTGLTRISLAMYGILICRNFHLLNDKFHTLKSVLQSHTKAVAHFDMLTVQIVSLLYPQSTI